MILWSIILMVLTGFFDIKSDLKLIYARQKGIPGKNVNHIRGGLLRSIGMAPAAWIMSHYNSDLFAFKDLLHYNSIVWIAGTMLFFWYWTLFDGIINGFQRLGFFHIGTTAILDRMQTNWPVWVRAVVKIGGTVIFTYLFIHIQ